VCDRTNGSRFNLAANLPRTIANSGDDCDIAGLKPAEGTWPGLNLAACPLSGLTRRNFDLI